MARQTICVVICLIVSILGLLERVDAFQSTGAKMRQKRQSSIPIGKVPSYRRPATTQPPTPIPPTTKIDHYNERRPIHREPAKNSQTEDELVEATLQLIEEGDANIQLLPDHRDITLVAGNTGAGKSTITKFVTGDNSDMEAYQDHHRILIRDKENKISNGSSIVSKTSFPDLMIDLTTKSAFYDLPGFKDTRSPSMEIANAYFIKRVADHARSVKIIFIVNFSSMRPSESRTDFLTMLNHATKMIKNPKKFAPAMALIASKVESDLTNDEVVGGIARFIGSVIRDLHQITLEESTLEESYDLLENLLITSGNSNYDRIGIFRQPNQVGPLSQVPIVQSVKPLLRDIIFNKLNYVPTTATDFGFALSPYAKSIAKKVLTRIHQRIVQASTNISRQILEKAAAKLNNLNSSISATTSCSSIHLLALDFKILQNATGAFDRVESRMEIFEILANISKAFKIRDDASGDESGERLAKKLLENGKKLDHFEKSSGQYLRASWREWTDPIRECGVALEEELQLAGATLNGHVAGAGQQTKSLLESAYRQLINGELNRNKSDLISLLDTDRLKLESLTGLSSQYHGLREFLSGTVVTLKSLNISIAENLNPFALLQLSCQDVDIFPPEGERRRFSSPFRKLLWIRPFEEVVQFLSSKGAQFRIELRDQIHGQQLEAQGTVIKDLKSSMVNATLEAERREKEMTQQTTKEKQLLLNSIQNLKKAQEEMEKEQKEERERLAQKEADNLAKLEADKVQMKLDMEKKETQLRQENEARMKEHFQKMKEEQDRQKEKDRRDYEDEILKVKNDLEKQKLENEYRMRLLQQQVENERSRQEASKNNKNEADPVKNVICTLAPIVCSLGR